MRYYLIRHGIAEDKALYEGADHPQRVLTAKGIRRLQSAMTGLARLDVRVERILSSPLKRARQTADIAAQHLGAPIEEVDWLADTPNPAQLSSQLGEYQSSALALVGHEPYLSELASWLLTADLQRCRFVFKKGGVMCLDLAEPQAACASLCWLLTPRQLRRLA